jgi:hypothetical protein
MKIREIFQRRSTQPAKLSVAFGEKPGIASAKSAELRAVHAKSGARGSWLSQLQSLKSGWEKNPAGSYSFTPVYARLRDKDNAFYWLDKAYQERSQGLTLSLVIEQAFVQLHSEPRYQDLLGRIGHASAGLKPEYGLRSAANYFVCTNPCQARSPFNSAAMPSADNGLEK